MNSDYFSNLSCIEEFYIKRDIIGDDSYLLYLKKAGDYYWFIAEGRMYFLDKDGNLIDGKDVSIVGDFDCSCTAITSLEGAPKEVRGNFWCTHIYITSLEGAPKEIGKGFWCSNTKITSLVGAPKKVGGSFYCHNTMITSLEGAPKEVGGDFYCNDTKITQAQLHAYLKFLENPTPEHIDETGHYRP